MSIEPETDWLSIGDVVAELRRDYPEVSHSSLRFLERERLVAPTRTPGGHRLYRLADIERIRQIKRWQQQRLSLDEIRQRLAAQMDLGPLPDLTERFLSAAVEGTSSASRQVLRADELGVPLRELFQSVLLRAQSEVGARWGTGTLRVGQEHEITEVVREVIAELSLRHAHPHPAGRPVLAACVAGEHHDLGLRMIVALLRAAGRKVHFLGADVDGAFLVEEVVNRQPAVVLLSATMRERLPAVEATVRAIREATAPDPVPIVIGGDVVRTHRAELERLGGIPASADDLAATLEMILAYAGAEVTA
jgi:methanogenic corrinoid protein MtbC1